VNPRLPDADQADLLGRRRARLLPMMAVLFLSQQVTFFSRSDGNPSVDHIRVGAWVLMTAVLLIVLNTGGAWFRPERVRAMVNDELARANRMSGMHWGFVAAMVAAIGIYIVQGVARFTTLEALHIVVSAGIVAALMRFGLLERRQHA
jgi:hypothetical protein